VDEDVRLEVRVAEDEVRGVARERDVAPVGRDREVVVLAEERERLGALGADVDALRGPRQAIAHEDVGRLVRVSDDEVVRVAAEDDEAPVRGEHAAAARAVALDAVRADARELERPGREVADEDVVRAVRVAGDEVVREAREGDEPPVCADPRTPGPAVRLEAAGADVQALGRAQRAVAEEDVGYAVRVARTRSLAKLGKTTKRPSAEKDGPSAWPESAFACAPVEPTLMRCVNWARIGSAQAGSTTKSPTRMAPIGRGGLRTGSPRRFEQDLAGDGSAGKE
jgi:hypothetical protein